LGLAPVTALFREVQRSERAHSLDEGVVVIRCMAENVGVFAIERLSSGGVRLVCTSSKRADHMRRKLKACVIAGTVTRESIGRQIPLVSRLKRNGAGSVR